MGTINYQSKRRPKYSGVFSFGNSKLPHTTAIFNLTSATDCPSYKLGLCQVDYKDGKNRCYAMKTERLFPKTSLAFRRKQAKFWDSCTSTEFINALTQAIGKKRVTQLRLNESGDFRCQADVDKADNIARCLPGLKVYCYTARKDLDFSKVKYLKVNGSGFTKPGISGMFLAMHKESKRPDGFGVCRGDCTVCTRCTLGKNTVVYLH